MKKVIIVVLSLVFTTSFHAQVVGFEGKRITVEATTEIGFLNKIFDNSKIYKSAFLPSFRPSVEVNYSLTNKSSLGVILSGSVNKFKPTMLRLYGNEKEMHAGGVSYFGIGIRYSFFRKDFISPVGSSFSIYAKINSVKSKQYQSIYAERSGFEYNYFNKTEELKIKFYNIGVTWNYMTFLSDKAPLYLKYGASFGFSFSSKYYLDGVEKEIEENVYILGPYGVADSLYHYFSYYEIFQFNLGVGFIL